ncbi:MAG: hypothetical protein Q6365_001190, partial [Candidatus Sigynarchaeota archaeon]
DLHDLAFFTPAGKRLTVRTTDAVLGGRFVLDDSTDEMAKIQEEEIEQLRASPDISQTIQKAMANRVSQHQMKKKDSMKTPNEKKLENFFETFWDMFGVALNNQRAIGCALPIFYYRGEDVTDFKYKVYAPRKNSAKDGESVAAGSDRPKFKWVCPQTRHVSAAGTFSMPPHLDILDWADKWQWWNYDIHKSRMHPLCLEKDEQQWYGIGEIEPCKVSLYALYNMERGILDRIAAWALQLLIFRIDFSKALGAKRAQLDELARSMGHENYKLLDKAEDLVQLNDKTGMGHELHDIALSFISLSTGFPIVWLKGNTEGAITGSEVDLTQVQLVLSNIQTKLNSYLKQILLDFYNIDADNLYWKMSIFTTAQAIQGQAGAMRRAGEFNLKFGGLKTPQRPDLGIKPGITDKTPGDD